MVCLLYQKDYGVWCNNYITVAMGKVLRLQKQLVKGKVQNK